MLSDHPPVYLVAGATGYLGRHIVAELISRGQRVRALVRDPARARLPGAHKAPALASAVDCVTADVARPHTLEGICQGVDHVLSALGVTSQNASARDIDFAGNAALLRQAEAAGVKSFGFVSAIGIDRPITEVRRAKREVEQLLEASPITHHIFRPTGFFCDYARSFAKVVSTGVATRVGDGAHRSNPIHGADLAAFICDKTDEPAGIWSVGGPEIFRKSEIAPLIFAALGCEPRITEIPVADMRAQLSALEADAEGDSRAGEHLRFMLDIMTHDAIGEPTGNRRLADYFAELAADLAR